jgi:hypothetical protein
VERSIWRNVTFDTIASAPDKATAIYYSGQLISFPDLMIATVSVGAGHIDLIEHLIEGLPIVYLAIQTA